MCPLQVPFVVFYLLIPVQSRPYYFFLSCHVHFLQSSCHALLLHGLFLHIRLFCLCVAVPFLIVRSYVLICCLWRAFPCAAYVGHFPPNFR